MSFDLLQQDPFVAPGAEQADAAKVLTAGNLGTDLDAALRFAERCGDVLRFAAGVGWLWWDGARWRPDAEGKARHLAMEAARAWTRACATYNGPDRNARVREAMTLEGASHIRNSVSLAENLPSLAVSHAALDRDPWLLNCRNGTLDLRTAELRPHRREDLITKLAPVNYHVGAAHGVFDRYLATISATAPDMPDFLARCFGAALTGDVSVESVFLLQGGGGSGKTTLTEAVANVLGDYAVKLPFESLCQSKHGRAPGAASPDLVPLRGARLAYATEGDSNSRLDSGRIKELSGGEPITVRPLYRVPMTIAPTWKPWLVSNYDPKTDSEDSGVWRRMVKLHFEPIPEDRRDPEVKSTLLNSPDARSAILVWCVRGCLDWQARGKGRLGLAIPSTVAAATEAYRTKQDSLAEWWDDLATEAAIHPSGWTSSTELREHYDRWCEDEGAMPVSRKRFSEYLERKGLVNKRGSGGTRGWLGITLY